MLKTNYLAIIFSTLLATTAMAKTSTYVTVEEARISKATEANPEMVNLFVDNIKRFEQALANTDSMQSLESSVKKHASELFKTAVTQIQKSQSFDDRPLYWARLQMAKLIRGSESYRKLNREEQEALMFAFELASRGFGQTTFSQQTDKKILITGFDPFFLDRNIEQSNPSGIAALTLDNNVLTLDGESAEVQSFIVPVRFADFDQGMIETMLKEHFPQVDMIATISMGRENFDLERFPALRRSAKAPGNLNVYTGASAENPLKPFLNGQVLSGAEFVEFSLPVSTMQKAKGAYKVIDNHKVKTLSRGEFEAKNLAELNDETSVNGSGGGYLSNEISYRSILLRNQLNPSLPVGHIHTPRIKAWKREEVKAIVEQIEEMLKQAIPAI